MNVSATRHSRRSYGGPLSWRCCHLASTRPSPQPIGSAPGVRWPAVGAGQATRRGDRFDGAFQAQRLRPGGAGSCGLRLGSVHLSRRACVVSSTPRETLERPPMGASSNHTESLPAGSLPRRFKENWVGELAAYVLRLWDERDLGAPRLGLFDADRPCPPRPLVPRSQEGPLHRRNRRPPAPH